MASDELKEKVVTWLSSQGYGTEMKVANALIRHGYEVRQSDFYIDPDPDSNALREIDIFARLTNMIGLLGVYPVIECKKSSKPWVLFTADRIPFNRLHSMAIMSDPTIQTVLERFQKLVENSWIRKDGRIAYGITEAFSSKEDETFKAAISATKAAIAKLNEDVINHTSQFLNFYFPTVVFDGPLFECYLDESGLQIVEEVDSAFLLFQIKAGKYYGSTVRIVTLASFEKYCIELKGLYEFLKQVLKPDILAIGTALGLKEDQTFHNKEDAGLDNQPVS